MINLRILKDLSQAKKYRKGSIFPCQSYTPEMFIILKGEAGVYLSHGKRNEKLVATMGPGSFFNEVAFMNKTVRLTTVALKDIIALPISQKSLLEYIKNEPDMSLELFKELCSRFSEINADYEKLSGEPWVSAQIKEPPIDKSERSTAPSPMALASNNPATPLSSEADINDSMTAPEAFPAGEEHIAAHFSLFPEGHGSYELPLSKDDNIYLMNKSYTCPICQKYFKALKVKTSRLYLDSTDSDLRSRYKNVEPLYYDIVTCPGCLFSALNGMFDRPDKTRASLPIELKALRHNSNIKFGADIDTYSVFAGYYLALICAPNFFLSHHLITARLLLKLNWLYQDCGDKDMETQTINCALDAFLYVYEHIKIEPHIEHQICLLIGELLLKQNDLQRAKDFFFKARTNRAGGRALHQHAENRMLYIRQIANDDKPGDEKTGSSGD